MNFRNIIGAIGFGLVGGYAYYKAGDYQVGGANVFPQIVAGGMVLGSVLMLLAEGLSRTTPADPDETLEEGLDALGGRMVLAIAISLLFVLLIPMIGFATASFILILAGCWTFGLRNPVAVLAGALGFAIVVPWAFQYFLHIRLPPELWSIVLAGS
ncbi:MULTISPECIES: tripartite tricarboxylate transporter TctB family protein [Devosia]|uniref:tripartite tricarboxylate transporter TctB family protein n=1 Tax=Devosia TaxID=46913 RepID=UPI001300798E|nr:MULTISPECIES: tripartite tricarboxylate transporter TctB family protein [Devosia]